MRIFFKTTDRPNILEFDHLLISRKTNVSIMTEDKPKEKVAVKTFRKPETISKNKFPATKEESPNMKNLKKIEKLKKKT